ncbi:serine hydrolase family protein [Candidatus Woesearchaeota archaeon]|nr:serine hydrolase family protein [Candidatus Woesearchaeota archaeon]
MNFFIIHGVYANPDANWFPWLKKEIEGKGYNVIIPHFPTPLDQSLESWLRTISHYEQKINEETVLIGHSLGAAFILNYLEQADKKIKAAILVAGFFKPIGSEYDKLNETFINKNFDWKKIKNNCKNFFVIGSDNDEYIPIGITKELSQNLGAELKIIHNGGHLNKNSGYDKFPELLDLVLKINNA